jgi:hypothetical protein
MRLNRDVSDLTFAKTILRALRVLRARIIG